MKTRFQSLPKKDREEVERIRSLHDTRWVSLEHLARESVDRLKRQAATRNKHSQGMLLATMLGFLKSDLCDDGIVRRLLDDNNHAQIVGFNTRARLGYLMRLAGGTDYSGGYDCLHVFDMLPGLAAGDCKAISRFINQFPAPFKMGHKSSVLLANAFYAILNRDVATFQSLVHELQSRSDTLFFRAMYDCLLATHSLNREGVASALADMLKGNKRQIQLSSSMEKLICIPGHALYNVCLDFFADHGIAAPEIPAVMTWDDGFHEVVHAFDHSELPEYFDFSRINIVLARWVAELPSALVVDELIAAA